MYKTGVFEFFLFYVEPAYLLLTEFTDVQFYEVTSNTLSQQNRQRSRIWKQLHQDKPS